MKTQININISSEIARLLGELEIVLSPWAILLVQFSDQTDPWPPLSKYENLFTSAGSGKMNMVDFFNVMSHGKLDVSGSTLFGPYTLSAKRADYGVTIGRNDLLNLAKSTATSAGVNLGDFAGVCVSCLGQVDLCGWVGGMAALCDTLSLEPSVLGQEMGHGYGLDHARLSGSTTDYQDPWDVMSTWDSAYMEPNSDFTLIGPGMNAWNMRGRGWLDETRVWTAPAQSWDDVVQLRPLHRTDLSGFLAAQIGQGSTWLSSACRSAGMLLFRARVYSCTAFKAIIPISCQHTAGARISGRAISSYSATQTIRFSDATQQRSLK
jgi:hypothetical protein